MSLNLAFRKASTRKSNCSFAIPLGSQLTTLQFIFAFLPLYCRWRDGETGRRVDGETGRRGNGETGRRRVGREITEETRGRAREGEREMINLTHKERRWEWVYFT